jgi:hypothetical protein
MALLLRFISVFHWKFQGSATVDIDNIEVLLGPLN